MKRKSFLSVILVSSLLIVWLIPSPALAGPPDNYTAKMVVHGMTMPMAKMANKMRVENPMMQGIVTVTLTDIVGLSGEFDLASWS